MFFSTVNSVHHLGRWTRVVSYLAPALAGAAGVVLVRRVTVPAQRRWLAGRAVRTEATTATRLMDAGWAEVVDDRGTVLARGQVILASARAGAHVRTPTGEVRSLRLAPGTQQLMPGHYWLRFETGRGTHGVEVVASPGPGDGEVAAIRWDDRDLPSSLVELSAS